MTSFEELAYLRDRGDRNARRAQQAEEKLRKAEQALARKADEVADWIELEHKMMERATEAEEKLEDVVKAANKAVFQLRTSEDEYARLVGKRLSEALASLHPGGWPPLPGLAGIRVLTKEYSIGYRLPNGEVRITPRIYTEKVDAEEFFAYLCTTWRRELEEEAAREDPKRTNWGAMILKEKKEERHLLLVRQVTPYEILEEAPPWE